MTSSILYTVSQIAEYLKAYLKKDSVLVNSWISGEVSNLSRSAAGHTYFTLKDDRAQLRCVMFRRNRGAEILANGQAVSVHGSISFYEVRGDTQMYVDLVRLEGMGILHLELERLKVQLEEEGLFDQSRKRPLPSFPQRIGVVTSEYGAAFHDIRTILQRRYPMAHVILCHASVQGANAASEIADAVTTLNSYGHVDVIIVARGGGSLEELWPFNQEVVARAIFSSRVPVINAVGHETDFTIADYVADMRAPTPSAAAELVVPNATDLLTTAHSYVHTSVSLIIHLVEAHRRNVEHLAQRVHSRAHDIEGQRQRIDDLTSLSSERIHSLVERTCDRTRNLEWRLVTLDPQGVLGRGYAIVEHEVTGHTVTSRAQVIPGDPVSVMLQDGLFKANVSNGTPLHGVPPGRSKNRRKS